jgi:bifunctional non-homologous end joining protein LigD
MAVKNKSVPKGKKALFPSYLEPMRANLVEPPVENKEGWIYEIKYDGYRALAYLQQEIVKLKSKGDLDYTSTFPPVSKSLRELQLNAVLDGEIIVFDENGNHDFSLVQNFGSSKQGTPIYYVFDILWLNGYSLLELPLQERKEILDSLKWNETIRKADVFDDGEALFEGVKKFGFEGIVCKLLDSVYTPTEKRSKYWLKVKHKNTKEYIIVGYVKSDSASFFKTVLLGEYVDNKLKYIHHSGHGFTDKKRRELFERFKALETKKPSVVNPEDVEYEGTPTWLKPVIVGQFEQENLVTKNGKIRHPVVYKGEREDKEPQDVIEEKPITKKESKSQKREEHIIVKHGIPKEVIGTWEQVENRPITSRKKVTIGGRKLELVNLEKKLWQEVTKGDLIEYYKKVAPYILKYLKDRPLALNFNPNGPFKENFFLRGLEGHYPEWAEVFTTKRKHPKKGKSPLIEWLVCNNLPTLLYIINLENIDIHPWGSRVATFTHPDYIIIDLDPTIPEGSEEDKRKAREEGFLKAVETALAAKEFLDKQKIKSFVKTSGKTGLHLYLPCEGIEYGEEGKKGQARIIAENICNEIHELVLDITTTSFSQAGREDKVYIDPNQNDYADRVACAYCCRANYQPTVSMPIEWKEVNNKLRPSQFTIETIIERLEKKGDLWEKILDAKTRERNSSILESFL